MSDINLFRVDGGAVSELPSQSPQVEKTLQTLFEANLEALLGVRFLATEYSTGPIHGGRLDTLGIDEDGTPVIIEYKRRASESVMNQGLYYLSWLLDHRNDFHWLVQKVLGMEVADKVDWSSPRIICIASDFSKYDMHAVTQISRSIELIRYRRFGEDMLLIEQVHTPRASTKAAVAIAQLEGDAGDILTPASTASRSNYQSQQMEHRIANSSPALKELFEATGHALMSLGEDVQVKALQYYWAYKRIKNIACVEVYPSDNKVTVFLKVNPDEVELEAGFTRDMRKINHFGTGNLEVIIRSEADLLKAQPLFQKAYDGS